MRRLPIVTAALAALLIGSASPAIGSTPPVTYTLVFTNTSTIDVDAGGVCTGTSTQTYHIVVHVTSFDALANNLHVAETGTFTFVSDANGLTYTGHVDATVSAISSPAPGQSATTLTVDFEGRAVDGSHIKIHEQLLFMVGGGTVRVSALRLACSTI